MSIEFLSEDVIVRQLTESMEKSNRGDTTLAEIVSRQMKDKFDYTKWQKEYFDTKTLEEISAEASCFEKTQPFAGDAVRL